MPNENNLYYQNTPLPPQMQMRQRIMKGVKKIPDAFPKWLSQYSIVVYILALAVVSFLYSTYSLPWYYMLSGVVAVLAFFLYGSAVVDRTSEHRIRKQKSFEKRIFLIAFIPRVVLTLLLYQIFMSNYGDSFGFETGDALYYDELGQFVVGLIEKGNFHFFMMRFLVGAETMI